MCCLNLSCCLRILHLWQTKHGCNLLVLETFIFQKHLLMALETVTLKIYINGTGKYFFTG